MIQSINSNDWFRFSTESFGFQRKTMDEITLLRTILNSAFELHSLFSILQITYLKLDQGKISKCMHYITSIFRIDQTTSIYSRFLPKLSNISQVAKAFEKQDHLGQPTEYSEEHFISKLEWKRMKTKDQGCKDGGQL